MSSRQPLNKSSLGDAATTNISVIRAWVLAIDSLVVSSARIITRRKDLSAGNLPITLRVSVLFGLVGSVVGIVGTILIGYYMYTELSSDAPSVLASVIFNLVILNNTPFVVSLVASLVAAVFLLLAVRAGMAARSSLAFLAIPLLWASTDYLVRIYAASLIGTPVVVEIKRLLDDEGTRRRGLEAAYGVLRIRGLPSDTRNELRSTLLEGLSKEGKIVEAIRVAGEIARSSTDYAIRARTAQRLPALMLAVAKGQSSQFCRHLYDEYIMPFPEEIRPSPYRFATDKDWSWIARRWDNERQFGSERNNTMLSALVSAFKTHSDTQYALYLLGDSEQLEQGYAATSAGLLAAFNLARNDQVKSTNLDLAGERFRRIAASTSVQSFVDDACLHYSEILVFQERGAEALDYLIQGYGRGDGDMSGDIAEAILRLGASLSQEDLGKQFMAPGGRESLPGRSGVHIHAHCLLGIIYVNQLLANGVEESRLGPAFLAVEGILRQVLASDRSIGNGTFDIKELREMRDGLATLRSFLGQSVEAPMEAQDVTLSLTNCLGAVRAVTCQNSRALPAGPSLFVEARSRASRMLVERHRGLLERCLGFGGDSPAAESMKALDANERLRKMQELDRAVRAFESAASETATEAFKRWAESVKRELPRLAEMNSPTGEYFVARRLDELGEMMPKDWMTASSEIESLASQVTSPMLQAQLWGILAEQHWRLAIETARFPAQQTFHLERAARFCVRAIEQEPNADRSLSPAVVADMVDLLRSQIASSGEKARLPDVVKARAAKPGFDMQSLIPVYRREIVDGNDEAKQAEDVQVEEPAEMLPAAAPGDGK
jgi:hypothetical protein